MGSTTVSRVLTRQLQFGRILVWHYYFFIQASCYTNSERCIFIYKYGWLQLEVASPCIRIRNGKSEWGNRRWFRWILKNQKVNYYPTKTTHQNYLKSENLLPLPIGIFGNLEIFLRKHLTLIHINNSGVTDDFLLNKNALAYEFFFSISTTIVV